MSLFLATLIPGLVVAALGAALLANRPAVRTRLLEANARYTPRGSDPATDPDCGWVHPKELHGLLLGVSRTGLAWDWSGRKELVPPV